MTKYTIPLLQLHQPYLRSSFPTDREVHELVQMRLRRVRAELGLTQRELAALAFGDEDWSFTKRLAAYETAKVRVPIPVLMRTARAVGHSLELFTENDALRVKLHALVHRLPVDRLAAAEALIARMQDRGDR